MRISGPESKSKYLLACAVLIDTHEMGGNNVALYPLARHAHHVLAFNRKKRFTVCVCTYLLDWFVSAVGKFDRTKLFGALQFESRFFVFVQ